MRIARYPKDVIADVGDHQRGVGFFTAVGVTSVLGSQLVIARAFVFIALAAWMVTFVGLLRSYRRNRMTLVMVPLRAPVKGRRAPVWIRTCSSSIATGRTICGL